LPTAGTIVEIEGSSWLQIETYARGEILHGIIAITLHKNTFKYSFMTVTSQAEDDFFIFGGLNGLRYGIELGPTHKSGCFLQNVLSLQLCFTPQ